ncbi:MAG TPA: hypothetical protein VNN09_15920 [Candidatus Competibacteraceae bacterium]|nr:hypothetical protein [Candidatus Competibacteraceae bacterium]
MSTAPGHPGLIVDANVREFFRGLVMAATRHQGVESTDDTLYYLVNLLTTFSRSESLFEHTSEGLMLRPLAQLYSEAVEATSGERRNLALQRLGDVALFISGVFPHSLSRKPVDVDYYIAMGGGAYGYLSAAAHETRRWRVLQAVFLELARNFTSYVDVLGEVCERAHFHDDSDILRLYELWLRTGSRRMAKQLRRLGIEPSSGSLSRH